MPGERTVHYETITNILRDAGLLKFTEATTGGGRITITGEVDGANDTFFLPDFPIVKLEGDGVVDKDDVLAFVDGQAVTVDSIVANKGQVKLAEAPAEGKVLLIRYNWSAVTHDFVVDMRNGVEEWLDSAVSGVYNLETMFASGVFPNEWKNITRLRTAGYLQIQDWGENVDTDGTSKDGYKKLEQAKSDLQDWINGIINNDTDNNVKTGGASFRSDGNVFGKGLVNGERLLHSDRRFHNRDI